MKKTLLILLFAALMSTAGWADLMNHPVTVAHVGGEVRWSSIALGADGIAHVVFSNITPGEDGNTLFLSVGDILYVKYDGTTASTPMKINGDHPGMQPEITCNSKGKIAVVWSAPRENSIYIRVYDPALNGWQAAEQVSDSGAWEPSVAIDSKGNITVGFWAEAGVCFAKSKINGVWEGDAALSDGGTRCMKTNVTVAPDDTFWAVWSQRTCDNTGFCLYETFFSKRTAAVGWNDAQMVNPAGLSQELPFIGVGPNNIPWVAWGDTNDAEQSAIVVARINGADNPLETLTTRGTQHGPRVVADIYNNCHIACQQGAGDWGNGILYMTNKGGSWQAQMMWGGDTKAGGISTDSFGNVAVCWGAYFGGGGSDVYINSVDAIAPRYFLPPVNLTAALSVTKIRHAPSISYKLGWSANPNNTDSFLAGYKIYVQENGGSYQPLVTVSKTTLTQTFDFTDLSKKRRFAITTVNLIGGESDRVAFF